MIGPVPMMLWELWRTSRFELLLRLAGQCGFILLILLSTRFSDDAQLQVIKGISVGLLLVTSFFSQSWLGEFDSNSRGFSFRLAFARPVSTLTLYLVPLLFCVTTSMMSYAVPAVFFSWLQPSQMPIAGPLLVIGTVVTAGVSAVWAISRRSEKIILLALVATAAIVWWHRAGPPDASQPLLLRLGSPEFFSFQPLHYVAALTVVVATVVLALRSIERQRHGDHPSLVDALSRLWLSRPSRRAEVPTARPPFSNRGVAQFWYEWRCSGTTVLGIGVAAAVLLLCLLLSVPLANPQWRFDARIWLGALVVCPVIYQMVGVDGAAGLKQIQGTTKLSLFDATRSLRNDQLISIKLLMISACSLGGWLCMLLAAVVHTLLRGSWQDWRDIGNGFFGYIDALPRSWQIAGLSNLLLGFVSGSACLLAVCMWIPGNHRKAFGAMLLLTLHVVALVGDANQGWAFRDAWIVYAWVWSAVIVGGAIQLLRRALVAKSISLMFFGPALAMWIVYAGSAVATYWRVSPYLPFSIPTALVVPACSLLLVPLVSVVIAPLVLASWRHR